MKRMHSSHSTLGFSLLELLVVIAIIGMLASLLAPSLQTARQKAQSVKCLSNLQGIGVAVQQYMADPDNGGKFPPIYNTGISNAALSSFTTNAGTTPLQPMQCLSNYGVTMLLLTCPADQHPDPLYGSYMWSPILQGELPQDVHIYRRGGIFTISRLSTMTVCTDNGLPHLGKLNLLRADGHVETRP
jgi:prepilin-type N-terminal cleavage/methylation domain-containing protein/prepilin-type processing-associated H-X9-DG protein